MNTVKANDLTFAVRTRTDDFGPDGADPGAVVTVVVTLLNLDGDPTSVEVDRTGVAQADVPEVAQYLAQRLAADFPRVTQIKSGATLWLIRAKPARPWHPSVYEKIKAELTARGLKANKAHALACKYAKRKGKPAVLIAAFHRDYP